MRSQITLLMMFVGLLGCNETNANRIGSQPVQTIPTSSFTSKTYVYDCENNFSLVARLDNPERLWVFFPSKTQQFDRAPSASGEKFTHADNWLWFKGQDLMVNFQDTQYKACKSQPQKAVWEHAKLSGVSYRAVGNEPGWVLEITQGEQLVYVGDYGANTIHFPFQEPSLSETQTRYVAQNGEQRIEVTISRGSCVDSMSGQAFNSSVNLVLNNKTLQGCGRALY